MLLYVDIMSVNFFVARSQVHSIDSIDKDIRYILTLLSVKIVTSKFFTFCSCFNYSFVSTLGKV